MQLLFILFIVSGCGVIDFPDEHFDVAVDIHHSVSKSDAKDVDNVK